MSLFVDDRHFKYFAVELERAIAKHGDTEDFDLRQTQQVEQLIELERRFRLTLVAHRWGPGVYRKFLRFICECKKNILAARPYFRERQDVFTSEISEALKGRTGEGLYRFSCNYQFILFAMKACRWADNRMGTPVLRLAEQITRLRTEIIEMNMPLAISRARVFFSRTPASHLTYMDLIQIASEGLMSGIDKYSPDGDVMSRVFRSTAIGRMTGNFIAEYSETSLHFFPADKRKIYRANKVVSRHAGAVDYDRLADQVNHGAKEGHETNPLEIADLMAAASTVSADSILSTDPNAPEPVTRFAAPDSCRPDVRVEEKDAMAHMSRALTELTIFERKLLRLKGVGASV